MALWEEFIVYVPSPELGGLKIPLCGLCGNTGMLETNTKSPAGIRCGISAPCICPNGRWIKDPKKMQKLRDRRASRE